MKRHKSKALWLGSLVLAMVVASGCLKSVDSPQTSEKKTYISVLHLSPAAPAIEVYLNDTKSSSGIAPGTFSSAYSAVKPSSYSVTFKKAGSDSVVASIPAQIYDSLTFWTVLLYNDPSNVDVARAVAIEDDFSGLTSGAFLYRFFHMSPNSIPVDFYIDDTKVSSSRQYADNVYGGYNSFSPYSPGYHNLKVKKAGSDSLIAQKGVELYQANAYTIFLKGVTGGVGGSNLTLEVLQAVN
jgi:hypothetical protein